MVNTQAMVFTHMEFPFVGVYYHSRCTNKKRGMRGGGLGTRRQRE